ncbi:MAG: hypothetical protein O8C63_02330 [Candidatus Methanoperedens sp.]|nr:hypothetical protein [Candidatus Methanoperedens sp.]
MTISAIDVALCLIDATRLEKSCTPPIKIEPSKIHKIAGNHPNQIAASIGPTIGPAAAIAEKCWPKSRLALAGT